LPKFLKFKFQFQYLTHFDLLVNFVSWFCLMKYEI
jgi:hypothetical protein